MPARKGTKGYYENRIDNDTITEEELAEYRAILEKEEQDLIAQQKAVAKARRATKKIDKAIAKREEAAKAEALGRALIAKYGDDVDVDQLGEAPADAELKTNVKELLDRLNAIMQSDGRSLLDHLKTNMGDGLIESIEEKVS